VATAMFSFPKFPFRLDNPSVNSDASEMPFIFPLILNKLQTNLSELFDNRTLLRKAFENQKKRLVGRQQTD
jgi:hypothetical protein